MNQIVPLTNNAGLSLAVAVWLAHEEYTNGAEVFPGETIISATTLLKPTRQFILSHRTQPDERIQDVMDFIKARLGHAIHDSIEHAWTEGYAPAMRRLGFPKKMIDKVLINPTQDQIYDGCIPVYLEQRHYRRIKLQQGSVIISGKFDQVINGELNDTKSTSVFAYINGSKEDDYQLQGSIYRWLAPNIVSSDVMHIQHFFTDWQRAQSKSMPGYPAQPMIELNLQLLTERETEIIIRRKLGEILANMQLPQSEMIRCTDKELWKSDPVYKYYSDPKKAVEGGRATKNFDDFSAAQAHCALKKKGVVLTIPGKVKACGYCPAVSICKQAEEYDLE